MNQVVKKTMSAFEKMQARMASRQKGRKEGGVKTVAAPKQPGKVKVKIDPLRNTKPLITRNLQLQKPRADIVDIPMLERQSVNRSFEVGNLVYFVSKDDNQYVSGKLSEFKMGGFWKIDKIVNPNNRNPALEEDEDPSRYVRTKPPTIKPEGYFKLMLPHDFEVELSLEFAHMLRDHMKDLLKKKEKHANYAKQKEKALAKIGKSLNDDIPSAIGNVGGNDHSANVTAKPKTITPFQQKKLLQKQHSISITTGISQIDTEAGNNFEEHKNVHRTSLPLAVDIAAATNKPHRSSTSCGNALVSEKKPSPTTLIKSRRSTTHVTEIQTTEKVPTAISRKHHTVLDVMSEGSKKKDWKEKKKAT